LLGGPLSAGVSRDAEVQDPAAFMSQHKDDIKDMEIMGLNILRVFRTCSERAAKP
jgi:hypothetical protein